MYFCIICSLSIHVDWQNYSFRKFLHCLKLKLCKYLKINKIIRNQKSSISIHLFVCLLLFDLLHHIAWHLKIAWPVPRAKKGNFWRAFHMWRENTFMLPDFDLYLWCIIFTYHFFYLFKLLLLFYKSFANANYRKCYEVRILRIQREKFQNREVFHKNLTLNRARELIENAETLWVWLKSLFNNWSWGNEITLKKVKNLHPFYNITINQLYEL